MSVVHISAGGIGWLPDLNRFYQVVSGLLREGGLLLMHEMHPLMITTLTPLYR